MSPHRDRNTRPDVDEGEEQSSEQRPVASFDPVCAGNHSIGVTLASDDDAGGDDRSSAAAVRSGCCQIRRRTEIPQRRLRRRRVLPDALREVPAHARPQPMRRDLALPRGEWNIEP